MRIVFFGSPDFAVVSLRALHASKHGVVAVVTQPDRPVGRRLQVQAPPVKVAAESLGIPVVQPSTTRTPEFVEEIRALLPDVLVVVAYGEILRRALLDAAPRGAINLHASLLPRYRGAAPVAWSILNGDSETGCSTMQIREEMDAGPVFLQVRCPIEPSDTAGTLTPRLAALGAPLLCRTLDLMEQKEIEPVEQDAGLVSYAPKLKKEDGRVRWSDPASRIWRQVRAFDPWPGTFSTWKGHPVKLWRTEPSMETHQSSPGTILGVDPSRFSVACGDGSTLAVLELQTENRPRQLARDFVNGARLHPGDRFES